MKSGSAGASSDARIARFPGTNYRPFARVESQLGAADVTLSGDVLDRIDEIVPPGLNITPADGGWQNPALEPEARRRR